MMAVNVRAILAVSQVCTVTLAAAVAAAASELPLEPA